MSEQETGQKLNKTLKLFATRLSEVPETEEGETNPLKFECSSITDLAKYDTYLVKFSSKMKLGIFGAAAEIIACKLAIHFHLKTPDFSLIEISHCLCDALNSNLSSDPRILSNINANNGSICFGSKFISTGIRNPLDDEVFTDDQKTYAELIFAFDGLLYNADRTFMTPNFFIRNQEFILYDHEKAFFFVRLGIIPDPKSSLFINGNSCFLSDHFFWDLLHKTKPDFGNFLPLLHSLDDRKINEIIQSVPYEISKECRQELELVSNHLKTMRDNSHFFQIELMRALK